MAVVHVVNTLLSKSEKVMRLMRVFTLHCLEYNILFQACHIHGAENELADALFCQQIDRFRALGLEAHLRPEILPQEVWSLGELRPTGP